MGGGDHESNSTWIHKLEDLTSEVQEKVIARGYCFGNHSLPRDPKSGGKGCVGCAASRVHDRLQTFTQQEMSA